MQNSVITQAEDTYNKLNVPPLPTSIKDVLNSLTPLMVGLSVLICLWVYGFGLLFMAFFSAFAGAAGAAGSSILLILSLLLGLAATVSFILSFTSGLTRRTPKSWEYLFWAATLFTLSNVVHLTIGSIISALIGAAVSFYVLFQLKSYYRPSF